MEMLFSTIYVLLVAVVIIGLCCGVSYICCCDEDVDEACMNKHTRTYIEIQTHTHAHY